MLQYHARQLYILVHSSRVDEGCAQQSIVPIKNNGCLVLLWLFNRSQPNLLVSKFAQEVSPYVIASSTFLDKVKREST